MQFAGVGRDFPVIREIIAMYEEEGQRVPDMVGQVYYNRGVFTAAIIVEGLRLAVENFGVPVTGEKVKMGYERITDFHPRRLPAAAQRHRAGSRGRRLGAHIRDPGRDLGAAHRLVPGLSRHRARRGPQGGGGVGHTSGRSVRHADVEQRGGSLRPHHPGAARRLSGGADGAHRGAAGLQRRRQEHDAEDHLRHPGARTRRGDGRFGGPGRRAYRQPRAGPTSSGTGWRRSWRAGAPSSCSPPRKTW